MEQGFMVVEDRDGVAKVCLRDAEVVKDWGGTVT
jgi:hypothetical protein